MLKSKPPFRKTCSLCKKDFQKMIDTPMPHRCPPCLIKIGVIHPDALSDDHLSKYLLPEDFMNYEGPPMEKEFFASTQKKEASHDKTQRLLKSLLDGG